jgi:hypothetical protein
VPLVGSLRQPRAVRSASSLIPAALLAVAVLAIVLLGLIAIVDPFGTETVDRSGPAVLEQMRQLEEFAAAEGNFTQDVDIEQDAPYLPDFLKGERVVALVTGTVRGVVDFGELDEDSVTVDEDRTTIRVVLPEPVLSDADIEESSARIIARNRGLVDRLGDVFSANPTDDTEIYRAAEEKVTAAARDSDLLDEARANTEEWLRTFLRAAGFETVEVDWQRPPT